MDWYLKCIMYEYRMRLAYYNVAWFALYDWNPTVLTYDNLCVCLCVCEMLYVLSQSYSWHSKDCNIFTNCWIICQSWIHYMMKLVTSNALTDNIVDWMLIMFRLKEKEIRSLVFRLNFECLHIAFWKH